MQKPKERKKVYGRDLNRNIDDQPGNRRVAYLTLLLQFYRRQVDGGRTDST